MSLKRVILCEDKYGGPFLRDLANLLKNSNVISHSLGVDTAKFYGACNVKLERQLIAKSRVRTCRFIILVDADGRNKASLRSRVMQHVPPVLASNTRIVVLDYEIEDWICVSLGIRVNSKPSVLLKQRFGYEKHRLKSYVLKLDIQRLQKCGSFCDFVNSL
jgi:hypothetical protein